MSVQLPSGAPITAQVTIAAGANAVIAAATETKIQARAHPVVALKITALGANAAKCYVGDSTVTTATGDELAPGASVTVDTNTPEQFYVAGTTGDKVSVLLLLAG